MTEFPPSPARMNNLQPCGANCSVFPNKQLFKISDGAGRVNNPATKMKSTRLTKLVHYYCKPEIFKARFH